MESPKPYTTHFFLFQKLYQLSGFLDIDKINPEAWPALIADLSAGENGITALAFGEFDSYASLSKKIIQVQFLIKRRVFPPPPLRAYQIVSAV